MCISQPLLYLLALSLSLSKVQVVLSAISALPFTKVKGPGAVLGPNEAEQKIQFSTLKDYFQVTTAQCPCCSVGVA